MCAPGYFDAPNFKVKVTFGGQKSVVSFSLKMPGRLSDC